MANLNQDGDQGNTATKAETTGKSAPANGTRTSAPRGFAAMNPEQQRRIASEGGRAAHASGNAHEFTSEEARAAGSKSRGGRGAKAKPADVPSGTGQ